jgi:hypothetical protein
MRQQRPGGCRRTCSAIARLSQSLRQVPKRVCKGQQERAGTVHWVVPYEGLAELEKSLDISLDA